MAVNPGKTEALKAKRAEAIERARNALELRKAGYNYTEIADSLGYADKSGAYYAISRALRRNEVEAVDEYRRLEVARLDQMLKAIWQQVVTGNLDAIDRALKVAARRARLQGLDAPSQQEHTGKDGGPIQIANLTEREIVERVRAVLDHHNGSRGQSGVPPALPA